MRAARAPRLPGIAVLLLLLPFTPAFALERATDVPRLWILASDGAVRHRDMVQPAMDSLVAMGTDAVPYLLPYLHTEDARERHAITDIFKGIGSAAVPALADVLGDGGEYHTLNTLNALGKVADSAATPAAIPFLHDMLYSVRSQAAETIGKCGGALAEDALFGARRDTVEIVRKSAVVGLGRLAHRSSVDSIAESLTDPWFGVRYAAAEALAQMDSGRAAAALLSKLEGRPLVLALNALADSGFKAAQRAASRYTSHDDPNVRAAALRVITRSSLTRRDRERIARLLAGEAHPLVRYQYLQALKRK
jgi:HEAT repeat protein